MKRTYRFYKSNNFPWSNLGIWYPLLPWYHKDQNEPNVRSIAESFLRVIPEVIGPIYIAIFCQFLRDLNYIRLSQILVMNFASLFINDIHTVNLPIYQWLSSSAAGIIAARSAVCRTRGVTRIRNILRRTALWGTLRITREVTPSRARYAGGNGCRNRRACNNRSLHYVRTAVFIALWKTVIVACPRAWWEQGRGHVGWRVTMWLEGTARRSTSWRVARVWFGAGLGANSAALWLCKLAGFEVTCWESNWNKNKQTNKQSSFNALSRICTFLPCFLMYPENGCHFRILSTVITCFQLNVLLHSATLQLKNSGGFWCDPATLRLVSIWSRAIAEKNSSVIVAIDGFHMIATIAEKVNGDRGDLRLTTSFASFVNFNMAAVNRRFLLEGCFFSTYGYFST